METATLEKKFLARKDSPFELEIAKTEGSYLVDTDGKEYIDLIMGWCVGNLGWANEEIKNTIRKYAGPDYVYPGFNYRSWAELAEMLSEMAPADLKICFRTTGGTESVETAMQIAMAYTGRKKFCSIEDSYHGNSIAALSIGASENHENIGNLLPGCLKIEKPLDEKALKKVETRLKKKDVAAFIMEPVLCNLGVHIPEKAFMAGLQDLCKKYGTLLIIDEVATGFGRTGKLFATSHFEIEPDILCLSKAITGGYAGMGATLTTKKIYQKVKDKVDIYSTYGWHPLSTEVALTNLKYFHKHEKALFKNIDAASQQFRTGLSQMKFKESKLSMIGLAIAVNVGDKKYAEKIQSRCMKNGLLFTTQEDNLVFFPALTIEQETIEQALSILEEAV
jgi:adenosylmethionine-8-amino-7-oxononanoate aminotransferase